MKESGSRERELLFAKVAAKRSEIEALITGLPAEIVDERDGSCIIQAVASNKDLAELVKKLEKFGIRELVQSGAIAIEFGAKTLAEQTAIETGLATSDTHQQTQDYQN
jgi:acetolactate synthase-1/3 small subunit